MSRNGNLCVWECTIEPSDLVVYEPTQKKIRAEEVESEDDIDIEKALEKTEKQKKCSEKVLMEEAEVAEPAEARTTARSKMKIEKNDVKKLAYKRLKKHYLSDEVHKSSKDAVLTSAAYHPEIRILVVGFSNGAFFLYEMPDVNLIHSLR